MPHDDLTMPPSFRAALGAALARPLLLDPRALDPIRGAAGFRPKAEGPRGMGGGSDPFERDGDMAVVGVSGPLAQRAWSCWMFSGDGYDAIVARAGAAFRDRDTRGVVLRLDSPGGEVSGCFEAVRTLRAMARDSGKPLVAYVDEMACSAAYALACAADEVVLPDTGLVGSIGVIMTVESYAEQLAAEGVSVALITSGAAKADGHPAVALSDDARARLQADVDQLAQVFAAEVAAGRPALTAKAALGLDARVLIGPSAVAAGLADHVGSFSVALERARSLASRSTPTGATRATGRTMPLLALLGVATEADAVTAVQALTNLRAQVRAATGADSDDAALGTVAAWKRDAAAAAELREQMEADRKVAAARERAELLDAAVASMRLTPAERAEDGNEGAFTTGMSNSALRAFAARPVTVGANGAPRPPAKPGATGASLTAEQMEIATSLGLNADDYAKALAAQG
jgi:signal peptide peptidase SppA